MKKKSDLELAGEQVDQMVEKVNWHIEFLGGFTSELYETLNQLQAQFDRIRNVTESQKQDIAELQEIRNQWHEVGKHIEKEYNFSANQAKMGVVGVGAGVGVVALAPSAAMGIATTFGVASTGTAIAGLHGIAATNAALAWLGGGALATGGGGMIAGESLLALAGPVGWTIAGAAALYSIVHYKMFANQKDAEELITIILHHSSTRYALAVFELKERIHRVVKENTLLQVASEKISNFGLDYNEMTEEQHYQLGSYVNLMQAATQLLVNPILGLTPSINLEDIDAFSNELVETDSQLLLLEKYSHWILYLANLIEGIPLNAKEQSVLLSVLKKQKELLKSFDLLKTEVTDEQLKLALAINHYKKMFHY